MSGFMKFSAFKRIQRILSDYWIVGYGGGKNFRISFQDFYNQLELSGSTGGGTPIFFEGNNMPSVNNEGQPLKKGDWALLSAGETYTNIGGGGDIEAPLGRWSIGRFNGSTWSLIDMGELPTTPVINNITSVSSTEALSAQQGLVLDNLDSVNNSFFVDTIVLWAGNWFWNDLTDHTKVVLARREDIGQIQIGIYNSALSRWIIKNVGLNTNIVNRTSRRTYITVSGGKLLEKFSNYKYFTNSTLVRYPVLSTLINVNIERKSGIEIKEISFVYFSVSTTNLQIIINLNDAMSSTNPVQSFVLYVILGNYPDLTNVVLVGENSDIKLSLTFDFSNVTSFSGFNTQSLDKSLWGRLNNDIVNSQLLPSKFLKVTESFSPFFSKNSFSGTFTKDNAQFFRDMLFIYPYDMTKYKYFFRVIRKNYTGDGPGNAYQILLFRQPINDSGTTNIVQIAALIKSSIDSTGVELLQLTPYDTSNKSKFYLLVDWNNLPSTYSAVLIADNNLLNEVAFKGGNGQIRAQLKLDTFADIVSSRLDNINLGAVTFKKSFFNASKIEDYMLTTDVALPSSPKLSSLQYVNLGASIRLACVDSDNKYWFINTNTKSIGYCNNISEVLSLTITNFRTFEKEPVLCKSLANGELLVVTKGSFVYSLKAEIWVSANGRTTWSNKMSFDNPNCETAVINQWGCSIFGDHIVLSGYGKRYTGNESPSEAPRYTDLNDKANYSIYYSFDGGNTWFNRLFNLGNYFDSNSKPYAHIHAVSYDPYWGEIFVTHGDMAPGLGGNNRVFRTTNLREWEYGQRNGSPIALTWANDITMKQGGVGLMQHTMLFGSDDVPNGIYRASKTDKTKCSVELAWNETKWAYQRTRRNPDGTPDTSSDYGIWGGYTFSRKNNNQAMYVTNLYFGGTHADDYKRNQVVATYDGYKFYKVWENDRDLITSSNVVIQNPHLYVDSDDFNNVLIQTRDSRFNPLIGGKPQYTNDYTLIVARGI